MPAQPKLSYECRHQLTEWVRLCYPCATEDSDFLRGQRVIVERELAALRRYRPAGEPSPSAGRDGGAA